MAGTAAVCALGLDFGFAPDEETALRQLDVLLSTIPEKDVVASPSPSGGGDPAGLDLTSNSPPRQSQLQRRGQAQH